MTYLLDTNIFIQAKNEFYGMDFCPAFWDWLDKANHAGKLFSIDKVKEELKMKNDELSEWTKNKTDNFFLNSSDEKVLQELGQITICVNESSKYTYESKRKFLSGADRLLIAHAKARGYTVVTLENYIQQDPKQSKNVIQVKIPNICEQLQVPYMSTVEMLRTERFRFILDCRS